MVCLCIQSAKTLLRAKIAPNYQIEFGKLVACIAVSSISNLNLKAFRREHFLGHRNEVFELFAVIF